MHIIGNKQMNFRLLSKNFVNRHIIENYHDSKRFLELCKSCSGYEKRWSCPPLSSSSTGEINKYKYVEVTIIEIPVPSGSLVEDAETLLKPAKKYLSDYLLNLEKERNGIASCTIGTCTLCEPQLCTRLENEPCRHPDKMRPSPEALGFNISAIMENEFGLSVKWAENGTLPDYLYLTGAIFYN